MPKYYDSKGKPHTLAEEIGRGGEGTVYFCEEEDKLVAKIYHEAISDEKAKKLQLMAMNKNERLLKVAAWVVETLHDKPKGKIVGFLMPRIKAKEIHELYSLKSRRRHFPQATWHYLIHTSTNLARAFYSLHKYKHVIGDVNHGNCVVLADGTVKLIDCDSYAISDGEKRFACEVGVATHLAPELQKANLGEIERKPEHDNFALAVVIFQLLFLGRHPFAGNYLGEKDKTLEDCIAEFRFAYGKNAKKYNVRRPPGTLNLGEVSPRVTELFERAFDEKKMNRPTPREWIEALVDLSENLSQCAVNPGHRYFNDLVACPWCRIEAQTGLMLFPFVFNEEHTNGETPFNIFTVEKLISQLGTQRNLPVKLEKPKTLTIPEPAREIVENAMVNRNHQLVFVGGYFLALVIMSMLFGLVIGTILGVFLMIYLFTKLSEDNKELQNSLLHTLTTQEDEWSKLEREFVLNASPKMFAGDLQIIRQKVKEYKDFQLAANKDMKSLETNQQHRDFIDYLRSFRLAESNIPGIGEKARQDLVEKKVWTAAEIDEKRLRKDYGVNVYLTKNLVKWRKELEKNYTYKINPQNLTAKKETLVEARSKRRRRIEKNIELSLETLQKSKVQIKSNQKLLIPKSEELAKKILQSRSNLQAVGDTSVALASLILITILVPFFGGIISEMSSSARTGLTTTEVRRDSDTPNTYDYSDFNEDAGNTNSFDYSDEVLSDTQASYLEVPNYDISDEAIEQLDDSIRKKYSDNLVRKAIKSVRSLIISPKKRDKIWTEAFDKVDLAMRVKDNNLKAFEEFGIVLYKLGHYKESLAHFSKMSKLPESEDSGVVELHKGLNFLALKKYKDARETLEKVLRGYPKASTYYKLGFAYKGSRDYKKAAKAFEYSIQMDDTNADAHYELGFAYFKLKDRESFNQQYSKLLDLDTEKAAKLLKISYKLPPKVNKKPISDGFEIAPDNEGKGIGRGSGSGVGNGSGETKRIEGRLDKIE